MVVYRVRLLVVHPLLGRCAWYVYAAGETPGEAIDDAITDYNERDDATGRAIDGEVVRRMRAVPSG